MTAFYPILRHASLCLIAVFVVAGGQAAAQVEWLKDASDAKVPSGPVTGQIDGKPVGELKFGTLDTAGWLDLGSPDTKFTHYKVSLRDADPFFNAKVFADFTVTVRKSELPDGKAFRSIDAPWKEQPGMRGEGYWVPEFLSINMESRKKSMRDETVGQFGHDAKLSGSIELPFTGRVEFGQRKRDKISVRLYLCFADKAKSCLAGAAELEIR